ncbi:MAG: LAGLIDADG family homing endonuclease [Candidatus Nanohalobium sp.]
MPTENQKQQIREKARNGDSVNQIKEELGLPKSTVYYHFKKEVGQKQKENALKLPEDDEVIGEICGVFAGDGNFYYEENNYKYRIKFTLNINQGYWKKLAKFLEENLQKKPRINHQENYNRTNLRYESKPLLNLLKEHLTWEEDKTATIKLRGKEYSKEFKIGFLRGLLDTDGHKDSTRKRYCFSTVSSELGKNISEFLGDLHITHKAKTYGDKRENCQDMNRIYINGENTKKLTAKIQPRHPKKTSY